MCRHINYLNTLDDKITSQLKLHEHQQVYGGSVIVTTLRKDTVRPQPPTIKCDISKNVVKVLCTQTMKTYEICCVFLVYNLRSP